MAAEDDSQVDDTRVEELFQQAKGLSEIQQRQFLDEHCGSNLPLRSSVERLLDAFRHAPAGDFHHRLLPKDAVIRSLNAASTEDATQLHEEIGSGATVGPYKILQKIGEGGMGSVFMAEQSQPVQRRVALKIVKPGMDTKAIVARFEAERQALAMMDHPNIAKVLDARETPSGRPYFVMELIHGVPINEYCNQQRLNIRERLGLFIPICEAVAHAHQKAIIHRDLKPSNILVAEYDHRPIPKIIDFGIAKAVNQKLTEKTLFTQYGQLVGTVEYMSPEQSKLNQLDIDTRSDIYSLGVVLYELLSGTTPFDRERLRSAAFEEMLRIIREEEPPTPSARATTSAAIDAVAQSRKTQPTTLSRRLRGDLDWITLKALSKERRDRYQTAIDFSEDIKRHLEDRPIEARRPSLAGRARRYVRRNKLTTAFMAAVAAAGILGVVALFSHAHASNERAAAVEAKLHQEQAERLRTIAESDMRLAEARLQTVSRQRKQVNMLSKLTSQARMWRSANRERSILLGVEAMRYSQSNGNVLLPLARESLSNSVPTLAGMTLVDHGPDHYDVAMTPHWMILRSSSGAKIELRDVNARNPFATTPRLLDTKEITSMSISHNGGRMVTAGDGLRLWRMDAREPELLAELSSADYRNSHLSLSPNGQWLAVRVHGGTVAVWDLTGTPSTPRKVGHMPGAISGRIFITNDGRWLALSVEVEVDEEKSRYARQLWDLRESDPQANAATLYENLPDSKWVRLIGMSEDGRWLATGRGRVFDMSAEKPHQTFLEFDEMSAATFSPDSKDLFAGLEHFPGLRRWNLVEAASNPEYSPSVFETKHGINDIAVNHDGRRLVASSPFGDAYYWDLTQDQVTSSPVNLSHGNKSATVAISQDGRLVGVGGPAPRLWDMTWADPELSSLILRRPKGADVSTRTAVSQTGRWIAATIANQRTKDGRDVELWDNNAKADPGTYRRQLTGFDSPILSLHISADDQWLAASSMTGDSKVWDLTKKDVAASVAVLIEPSKENRPPVRLRTRSVIADNSLFTAGVGGDVFRWDLLAARSDNRQYAARYADSQLYGIAVSPDRKRLATASSKGIRVWDLERPADVEPIYLVDKGDKSDTILSFSSNGCWLAEETYGIVRAWDLDQKKTHEPRKLELWRPEPGKGQGVWQMVMSPDPKWLYATRYNGEAKLWDLTIEPPSSRDLSSDVQSAAISSDSRWLVTTHRHGNVQLWDLLADDLESSLIVLGGHEGPVWKAEFSGDSKWLATFGGDGTIRRWPLDANQLIEYGRTIAGRRLLDAERGQAGLE